METNMPERAIIFRTVMTWSKPFITFRRIMHMVIPDIINEATRNDSWMLTAKNMDARTDSKKIPAGMLILACGRSNLLFLREYTRNNTAERVVINRRKKIFDSL
jgi:hypothetical protein